MLQREVDLRYVTEVVGAVKVGKTGHAYVVTEAGDLIAASGRHGRVATAQRCQAAGIDGRLPLERRSR